jgi:hypothetical protein
MFSLRPREGPGAQIARGSADPAAVQAGWRLLRCPAEPSGAGSLIRALQVILLAVLQLKNYVVDDGSWVVMALMNYPRLFL